MRGTAQEAWSKADLARRPLISRCQKYAAFTLPGICPPDGYSEELEELQTDYQSLGAQLVNSLANKLMLAAFSPSTPFFRLDIGDKEKAALQKLKQFNGQAVQAALSVAEKNCIKNLDTLGVRPELFSAFKHKIITGNALMVLGKKKTQPPMRILGLMKYVVQRNMLGKVIDLIIREEYCFDELEDEVQAFLIENGGPEFAAMTDSQADRKVHYFTRVKWNPISKKYVETASVEGLELPSEFGGQYTEEENPYRVLVWGREAGNNYGTGLVEEHSGDFAALSTLSESEVMAAILASEFRWLVNPAGATSVAQFNDSKNGEAIPGVQNDITPLVVETGQSLQIIDTVAQRYVERLGKAFVLGASVIRNAERVTAEEVRLVANELETTLGGVYSRLAINMQLPIAYWLVSRTGVEIAGSSVKPTIITGLDALSRNGDLDNLKACLQDIGTLESFPPQVLSMLNMSAIASAIFAARGIDGSQFVKTPEQVAQEQQEEQANAMAQNAAGPAAGAIARNATGS